MNTSAHTSGNDDAIAELANKLRTALRQLICRLRHGNNGDGPGRAFQQKPLLYAVGLQPCIGVAEPAPSGEMTAPTMSGDVRNAETACLAQRMVPDPKDGRGSALMLAGKGAELINDLKRRRRDWLASQIDQVRADGAGTLGWAVRYLDEIGK